VAGTAAGIRGRTWADLPRGARDIKRLVSRVVVCARGRFGYVRRLGVERLIFFLTGLRLPLDTAKSNGVAASNNPFTIESINLLYPLWL
jgi:hypothetical protein